MSCDAVLDRVGRTKIIAILRGELHGHEVDVCETLVAAGIEAMEVSLVSDGALQAIERLARHFGNRASIGAGTVLEAASAERVAGSGGTFIVSPDCSPAVIERTRALGLASFPGAYTPTEVLLAKRSGADAVKIFPAVSLGPDYIRALLAPLPETWLVPTGGITLGNAASYLQAGAFALGIASDLVSPADLAQFDAAALHRKATAFVNAVRGVAHA